MKTIKLLLFFSILSSGFQTPAMGRFAMRALPRLSVAPARIMPSPSFKAPAANRLAATRAFSRPVMPRTLTASPYPKKALTFAGLQPWATPKPGARSFVTMSNISKLMSLKPGQSLGTSLLAQVSDNQSQNGNQGSQGNRGNTVSDVAFASGIIGGGLLAGLLVYEATEPDNQKAWASNDLDAQLNAIRNRNEALAKSVSNVKNKAKMAQQIDQIKKPIDAYYSYFYYFPTDKIKTVADLQKKLDIIDRMRLLIKRISKHINTDKAMADLQKASEVQDDKDSVRSALKIVLPELIKAKALVQETTEFRPTTDPLLLALRKLSNKDIRSLNIRHIIRMREKHIRNCIAQLQHNPIDDLMPTNSEQIAQVLANYNIQSAIHALDPIRQEFDRNNPINNISPKEIELILKQLEDIAEQNQEN